jgi:hypothetical protein
MNCRKAFLLTFAMGLLIIVPMAATANKADSGGQAATVVTAGAPALSISDLLPERLAGASASGEIKEYAPANVSELAADQAAAYQEYQVTLAASRLYGATRVEVYRTQTPFAAFGLYSYLTKENPKKLKMPLIGAHSGFVADGLVFWKRNYFVKVSNATPGGSAEAAHVGFASAVEQKIPAMEAPVEHPLLFDSLPKNSRIAGSEKYFLGPEGLNAHLAGARDRFSFDGEAEAALAEYRQTGEAKPLKLVIVEYHTPQFATDALNRLDGFVATLGEDERQRFLTRRVGNFIVGATSFEDPEFAESLLNSIEYPYVVKWLQNPAIPTNDPFAIEKAGKMLVSTFSLIGLSGGAMLLCGTILGTTIFLRRRKQQRAAFSDAGGMIGLHIDPVEESLLSLPPHNEQ